MMTFPMVVSVVMMMSVVTSLTFGHLGRLENMFLLFFVVVAVVIAAIG